MKRLKFRNPWRGLTPKAKYMIFRLLAFIFAAGLPFLQCVEMFKSPEPLTVTLTLGGKMTLGVMLGLTILGIVFYQQVVRTVKRWICFAGWFLPGVLYLITLWLEKAVDLIPKFRAIFMWWTIGALIGLALSCVAISFWGGGLLNYAERYGSAAERGAGKSD